MDKNPKKWRKRKQSRLTQTERQKRGRTREGQVSTGKHINSHKGGKTQEVNVKKSHEGNST